MNPMFQIPALDSAAIGAFRRDGYLLVPSMFTAGQMAEVSRWTEEIGAWPEVAGRHMVYGENSLLDPGKRVLSRIENFCPFHEGFDELLRGDGVMRCISRLLDEDSVLFKDKINFKSPGGDGFKAHQDVQAGWSDYASLHITMLLSIDDATPDNGCLEIAPGRHREGLLGEMWKPLNDDGVEYRALPTKSGDVVFFDSFAPHRSGPNLSSRGRRVLYVTYNRIYEGDHRVPYFADKRKNYPPDCEREPGKTYQFKV